MATPLTHGLSVMSSEGQPHGFCFWFLELVALGCVLVAVEGRFAMGEIISGLEWLTAGLVVGAIGFKSSQIIESGQGGGRYRLIGVGALVVLSVIGITFWMLARHRPAEPTAVVVGLKDPQEWIDPNGQRYPQSNHPIDAGSARLTMKVGEFQSLNPCVAAPASQEVVNPSIYVDFERGIEVVPDGNWWKLNSATDAGGVEYVGAFERPIDRGSCGGGPFMLRFRTSHAGPVTIQFIVTAQNIAPVHSEMRVLAR